MMVKIWFQNKRSKLKKILRQGQDPTVFLNSTTNGTGDEDQMESDYDEDANSLNYDAPKLSSHVDNSDQIKYNNNNNNNNNLPRSQHSLQTNPHQLPSINRRKEDFINESVEIQKTSELNNPYENRFFPSMNLKHESYLDSKPQLNTLTDPSQSNTFVQPDDNVPSAPNHMLTDQSSHRLTCNLSSNSNSHCGATQSSKSSSYSDVRQSLSEGITNTNNTVSHEEVYSSHTSWSSSSPVKPKGKIDETCSTSPHPPITINQSNTAEAKWSTIAVNQPNEMNSDWLSKDTLRYPNNEISAHQTIEEKYKSITNHSEQWSTIDRPKIEPQAESTLLEVPYDYTY
ncbi:unnamed protein product [Trichobilharzia regenti]|nr:unnamed protein product [Trichobilharzia regenti]